MTIYQQITTDTQYYKRPEFHLEVDNKLYSLFQLFFNSQLKPFNPDSQQYFKYNYNSSSMLRLVYHFSYQDYECMAAISVDKMTHFSVEFTFDNGVIPENMPIQANSITIIVTDELDFKSATIQKRFNFGWSAKYNSQELSRIHRTSIFIRKLIDSEFNLQTIIEFFVSGQYQSLVFESTESLYFGKNIDFEKTYIKLLHYCETNPELFSSVFVGYPSHIEMSKSVSMLNDFLNKCEVDYRNSCSVLKDQLLLLDMQNI